MIEVVPFLTAGIVLGLTAGISPGPLLTLVIAETLKHGRLNGIKVAIAPLLTDVPIVLITFLVLSKLSDFNLAFGLISIVGGLFVLKLSYESIKTKGIEVDTQGYKAQSIRKGIAINALSPHPYLFWLTVGAPTAISAYKISIFSFVAFIVAFYVFLIGSKIGVALIVDKSREILKNKAYIVTMRILGIILLGFAMLFIKEGLHYLI